MIHTLTVQYGHVVNVQAESEIKRAVGSLPHRTVYRDRNALRILEWDFEDFGACEKALARLPKYPGFVYLVGDQKITWDESEVPRVIAPPTAADFDLPETQKRTPAPDLSDVGGPLPTFLLR